MPRHAVMLEPASSPPEAGTVVRVAGIEAEHALKSKRLRVGDDVRILDGFGMLGIAQVASARRSLELEVISAERVPEPALSIEVCSATPKGQRLDKMIDQLGQVGVRSWRAMSTRLGVVDPREHKLDRMTRIAREAAKQSSNPWAMRIGGAIEFERACDGVDEDGSVFGRVVIAQPGGRSDAGGGCARVRVLVGPEGGFTGEELAQAERAGVVALDLGPTVLRIETAAVVSAWSVLDAGRRGMGAEIDAITETRGDRGGTTAKEIQS